MRRILVESARRKKAQRHGGGMAREPLAEEGVGVEGFRADQMLELDEALKKLASTQPDLARLVELRFFTGLNIEEAAQLLGISERTAKRNWTYARAFLRREMEG
jgi:RNA polymerase sigma factor (TIGR02999 family)